VNHLIPLIALLAVSILSMNIPSNVWQRGSANALFTLDPSIVTQPPSLAYQMVAARRMLPDQMPGTIVEGAMVDLATVGSLTATPPDVVADGIVNTYLDQRPLLDGIVQSQAVIAAAPTVFTFTPNAVLFPGVGNQYIYAVLIQVDFSGQISKSPIDALLAGFTRLEAAISMRVVTSQPANGPNGTARVRIWLFPGTQLGGNSSYEYLDFRAALGAAPLNIVHNIVVTLAAGVTGDANASVALLTRGHPEIDTFVNRRIVSDSTILAALGK